MYCQDALRQQFEVNFVRMNGPGGELMSMTTHAPGATSAGRRFPPGHRKPGFILCHTSSGRYRFREAAKANDTSLPCQEERVKNAPAHTRHKAGSPANQCVSCHMPMTESARMRRSDHSMRPPTPAATLAWRSPNACNLCHIDQKSGWADKHVRAWASWI